MDAATPRLRPGALPPLLAGLQAGMLGACWMLLWLGLSAVWQQRSFWTAENLMASAFYGGRSIHNGFSWSTVSGFAIYLTLYSTLGALFALAAHGRISRRRTILVAVVCAISWYYLSFRLLWKLVMPLVALLHIERTTMLGHLLYGVLLGRFPIYLPEPAAPPEAPPVPLPDLEPTTDSAPPEALLEPLPPPEASPGSVPRDSAGTP
jgi:hypothetical protein